MDLVIRGGTVLDGSGAAPRVADVGVQGGRISAVGDLSKVKPESEIDAEGLTVTPGFIDIHSHSDYTLLVDPRAVSAISQGVTLEVIGNCGFGCAPIADPALAAANIYGFNGSIPLSWATVSGYLEKLETAKPAVNVIKLVPNGQLRRSTLGVADRPATPQELGRMKSLLAEGLEEGAFGYSTGLEYPAERGAPEDQIRHPRRAAQTLNLLRDSFKSFRAAPYLDALAIAERHLCSLPMGLRHGCLFEEFEEAERRDVICQDRFERPDVVFQSRRAFGRLQRLCVKTQKPGVLFFQGPRGRF